MEKQIWLDTTKEEEEKEEEEFLDLDYDYFKEELEQFVKRYEKRYDTSVESLLLISERDCYYGNYNGLDGATGYRLIKDLDEILETSSDDIKIYVDSDKLIHVDYFDHDGANYSVIKLIPGSVESAVFDECNCYACELDYVEMLQKKSNLKPTKFWQEK